MVAALKLVVNNDDNNENQAPPEISRVWCSRFTGNTKPVSLAGEEIDTDNLLLLQQMFEFHGNATQFTTDESDKARILASNTDEIIHKLRRKNANAVLLSVMMTPGTLIVLTLN